MKAGRQCISRHQQPEQMFLRRMSATSAAPVIIGTIHLNFSRFRPSQRLPRPAIQIKYLQARSRAPTISCCGTTQSGDKKFRSLVRAVIPAQTSASSRRTSISRRHRCETSRWLTPSANFSYKCGSRNSTARSAAVRPRQRDMECDRACDAAPRSAPFSKNGKKPRVSHRLRCSPARELATAGDRSNT
jgi:hypothetical protein